tara:strand:+ start:28 stop:435 length:408 start_codon:yes stop_codon:yes gene_type:complete
MIQRKQTLFIIISLVLTSIIIFFIDIIDSSKCNLNLSVSNEPVLNMFFCISLIVGIVSFFFFKRRVVQYKMCLFNMYFQICPLFFSFNWLSFKSCYPLYDEILGILFIYAIFLFYGLASLYIKKDDDLVKSSNRI